MIYSSTEAHPGHIQPPVSQMKKKMSFLCGSPQVTAAGPSQVRFWCAFGSEVSRLTQQSSGHGHDPASTGQHRRSELIRHLS